MDTNTFFEQNSFFFERKVKRVWQSLGKLEGGRFVVGIDKLATTPDDTENFQLNR